jgi:type I restriction enzyme R subunit
VIATPAGERRKRHHGARDDRAAYVLWPKPGVPAAVVATVGVQHDPGSALPRAIRQAQRLDAPLAYASNGREIVEHFIASGRTDIVSDFTSPQRAWRAYARFHDLRGRGAELLGQWFDQGALARSGARHGYEAPVELRYYQLVAMNRVLAAYNRFELKVAGAVPQALVRIAAGAGATVTAIATIAKLVTRALVHQIGQPFGVLYLDDRPAAMTGLGPLGTTARWGEAGEVTVTLRSVGAGVADPAGLDGIADLADDQVKLIVVNLAHGGMALDAGTWTPALDRFPQAFRFGLVDAAVGAATPVHHYFGAPVYRYTRANADADGYLNEGPPAGAAVG